MSANLRCKSSSETILSFDDVVVLAIGEQLKKSDIKPFSSA